MIPDFLQPYLWSYDMHALDLKNDKGIIVFQVLNLGSKRATDWLFSTYNRQEIAEVANTFPQTQWNKKSLRLWSIVLGINPREHRLPFSQQ